MSIIRVGSPDPKDIKRMSGTIMGGGTLIGLAISLLGVDNYNDILELAKKGDHTKVDLTVIYMVITRRMMMKRWRLHLGRSRSSSKVQGWRRVKKKILHEVYYV